VGGMRVSSAAAVRLSWLDPVPFSPHLLLLCVHCLCRACPSSGAARTQGTGPGGLEACASACLLPSSRAPVPLPLLVALLLVGAVDAEAGGTEECVGSEACMRHAPSLHPYAKHSGPLKAAHSSRRKERCSGFLLCRVHVYHPPRRTHARTRTRLQVSRRGSWHVSDMTR
jgi:hypothetical protein